MQEDDIIFEAFTNKKYSDDAEELDEVLRLIVRIKSVRRFRLLSLFSLPFLSSKVSTMPVSAFILHAARGISSYESAEVWVKAE